jgi:hypothetical protein
MFRLLRRAMSLSSRQRRAHARVALSLLAMSMLPRCAATPPAHPKPAEHRGALHWYPLDPGAVWSYSLRDLRGGPSMLIVTRVVAVDDGHVVLSTGQTTSELRVTENAIVRAPSGAVLLRVPPRLGDKWPGADGANVEVTRVEARIVTEAGTYEGCAETAETFGGDEARVVRTTFCPEIGPVMLDARPLSLAADGAADGEIAHLRSYTAASAPSAR